MIKTPSRSIYLIFIILLLPALLIACAPNSNPSDPLNTSGAADASIPFVGDASQTEATAETQLAAAGPAEFDADGVPVGYTEEGRPYRGSLDAPIVMEEFSDYQCPYCQRFAKETMPGLLAEQIAAGEVLLVFYDFPLTTIHPQAAAAANAARCVGEQGAAAYWAMHDQLFANISEWSNGRANEIFATYAAELGVTGDDFLNCLEEDRYADEIEADLAIGMNRGLNSTPSFFLNDQPVIGAYPLDYFNQAIAAVASGEALAGRPEPQPQAPAAKPTPATIVMADIGDELGDPDAPVTIVEYTDYQCPYCQRHSAETLPRMIAEMVDTGRVRYIVKDFPLDSIHPEARDASVAARCAGEQNAYWEMHDALFTRQQEWGGFGQAAANESFAGIAADLALDGDAFAACLSSGRYDDVIQDNLDEGVSLGVRGTPAFFINGFPISGAQPYELFEYAVGLAEEGTLADAYGVPEEQAQAEQAPSGPVEIDTEGAYSVGAADAPVVVVEFTDFQCSFCSRHFLQTYPQIKAEYVDTGKVRYVFMDFPLTSIHPHAQKAAEAARCAGDQGAYMEMHDALFGRQEAWSNREDADEIFATYAAALGLDAAAFGDCLAGGEHEAAVLADLNQGVELGIDGTPAFFVNGNFISGAQPFEVFQEAIESSLSESG